MKNKLMMIGIAIFLILASSITVYAADYTVLGATLTLSADKSEVKVGETFTVTLKATCSDGINGVDTTYSYETEKLELVSADIANSKFASLGVDNQITVISNSTESIQSADIYILTLKVKEGVKVGSTAKISIAETLLDSNTATNSEHTIPAQQITVTIIEEAEGGETLPPAEDEGEGEPTPPPAEDEGEGEETLPPAEDKGDGEETLPPAEDKGDGEETLPPAEDKGDGEQTPPPAKDEGKGEQTPPTTGDKKDEEKDNTVIKQEIPKAGQGTMISFAILIIAIVTVVTHKKNKNYKDIK